MTKVPESDFWRRRLYVLCLELQIQQTDMLRDHAHVFKLKQLEAFEVWQRLAAVSSSAARARDSKPLCVKNSARAQTINDLCEP